MTYANKAHLTPPMSLKFILSFGFDQCYMSQGHMPIKPHMCHFTYVVHVYVIKACVFKACFTKFISSLCHLNQVYFTLGLEVCASFGLVSLRSNHLHLVLMPYILLVIHANVVLWNLLKTCSNMHMDLSNQMVPLIFMLAHFTSSFSSCVIPLNLYQSQHVVTFYNFREQDTRY
jgi:hypothetical protein